MRRPYIKVCGVTTLEDALAVVAAGAHAVGFVFVPGSPRRLDPAAAAAITAGLPEGVARVGVVADLGAGEVRALVRGAGLTAIQAHGRETAAACSAYGVPVVKAFAAGSGIDLDELEPFRDHPILLDGGTAPGQGGLGRPADWSAAAAAVRAGYRVLLAGGLGPRSVRPAVEAVSPIGVDLNSAVERSPGQKDPDLVAAAVRALEDLDPALESTWPW